MSFKFGYAALNLLQFGTILASGVFRKQAWQFSDHVIDIQLPSPALAASNWLLIVWLISIAIAAVWALIDRPHRKTLIFANVVSLPILQLFWWLFYAG